MHMDERKKTSKTIWTVTEYQISLMPTLHSSHDDDGSRRNHINSALPGRKFEWWEKAIPRSREMSWNFFRLRIESETCQFTRLSQWRSHVKLNKESQPLHHTSKDYSTSKKIRMECSKNTGKIDWKFSLLPLWEMLNFLSACCLSCPTTMNKNLS